MRLLAVLLCLLPLCATAADDDIWMSVQLDGRKIGQMHTTREVHGERVVTTQTLDVELDRTGTKMKLSTREVDTETADGKPLAFESRTEGSGNSSLLRGKLSEDGKFAVTVEVGGARQQRVIEWPKNALLAEGMRLAEQRSGFAAGTHFTEVTFQAESLDAVEVESTVGAREKVDLPEGTRDLTRVEQILHLPDAPARSTSWIDGDGNVRKLTLSLLGYELTMLACSRECAQAPNQPADILKHAMAPAPAALTPDELHNGVILNVSASDGGAPLHFAATDEQRVAATTKGLELRIAPLTGAASNGAEAPPTPADSQRNDWLQSDAPEIRKLAREGAGDARTPREQMQRLENFVRRYIRTKSLNVGYASALEVAKKPEGDCTEHAVLLAALGHALGIPTRVVDGLAYTDHYAGMDHVFVPHAWAQAWIDGHWRSFDAALFGFDAGHIALSVGDGDPWRFYAGFDTLGRMRIDAAAPMHATTAPPNSP
jgi:transglutaminase-like putative cysteine protease